MVIYTDGACIPNPGFGSWAYIVTLDNKLVTTKFGVERETTNNRMEYMALIKAIQNHGPEIKEIKTDSTLLVDTCMSWRHKWKEQGWRLKRVKQIKNLDLVLEIDRLLSSYPLIIVSWVRGHNGDRFNEMADELAGEALNV